MPSGWVHATSLGIPRRSPDNGLGTPHGSGAADTVLVSVAVRVSICHVAPPGGPISTPRARATP